MTVSKTFLVFDDLDSFRSAAQVFCRTSLSLGFSDVFLVIRLELWVYGGGRGIPQR